MSAGSIQQHLAEGQRASGAGLRDKARSHFEAVLAIDVEEPTARNWLGADALARRDAPAAAMHFEAACRREPRERSHWINLATARRSLGEDEPERAALEQVLAIDEPSPEFAEILGHAKQYVGERQRKIVGAVDAALAEELAGASERDRRRM